MPLLAARSLYEAAEIAVVPPVEELVAGRNWRWPQEVTVQLTGVAASPAVGKIAVYDSSRASKLYPFPRRHIELTKPYTAPRRKPEKALPPPETVVVSMTGAKAVATVGTGTVKTVFDLLDDEILILMEAA